MATNSVKPPATLVEENRELTRQIAAWQSTCHRLASYNQALLAFCWSHQLNPPGMDDVLQPQFDSTGSWPRDNLLSTPLEWNSEDVVDGRTMVTGSGADDLDWYPDFPGRWKQDVDTQGMTAGLGGMDESMPSGTLALGGDFGLHAGGLGGPPMLSSAVYQESGLYEPLYSFCGEYDTREYPNRIDVSQGVAEFSMFLNEDSLAGHGFSPNITATTTTNEDSEDMHANGMADLDTPVLESGLHYDHDVPTRTTNDAAQPSIGIPTINCAIPQPLAPTAELETGFNTSTARGKLDEYILVFSQLVRRITTETPLPLRLRKQACIEGVLWAVREAWPQAEHFWKVTASFQGFLQSELWRNFPGEAEYQFMHPSYRPTATQLSTPHSPIIDWLPWPDLRDKVIQYQDQLDVDFVCKMAIQNVVAHRRTRKQRPGRRDGKSQKDDHTTINGNTSITAGPDPTPTPHPTQTSFRVWELCLLEEHSGLRPPSNTALIYRPQSAPVQALGKAYGLEYDDFQTQKLHRQFFDSFPALFVDSAVSDYVVQSMPAVQRVPAGEDVLGSPQGLSRGAVERLERAVGRLVLQA